MKIESQAVTITKQQKNRENSYQPAQPCRLHVAEMHRLILLITGPRVNIIENINVSSIGKDRSTQTVQVQIRLLLQVCLIRAYNV